VALHIEAQLVHRLIIESDPLLALEETVMHAVWRNRGTVLAVTSAESVSVLLEGRVVLIDFNVDYRVEGLLSGLAVLTEATMHIDGALSSTQCSNHELWICPRESSAFRIAISHHCVLINPHD